MSIPFQTFQSKRKYGIFNLCREEYQGMEDYFRQKEIPFGKQEDPTAASTSRRRYAEADPSSEPDEGRIRRAGNSADEESGKKSSK